MPEKPSLLRDDEGRVRVMIPRLGYADYLNSAVGQLRPYAVGDPNAGAHLRAMLDKVRDAVADPRHRALVGVEHGRVKRAMRREED